MIIGTLRYFGNGGDFDEEELETMLVFIFLRPLFNACRYDGLQISISGIEDWYIVIVGGLVALVVYDKSAQGVQWLVGGFLEWSPCFDN